MYKYNNYFYLILIISEKSKEIQRNKNNILSTKNFKFNFNPVTLALKDMNIKL